MRNVTNILLALVLISLYSCSGSDTYRGLWKALDERGQKFDINFDAKSFTVKDSTGKTETYKYKQNSVSIQNSVETYGIQVIKDAAGRPLYIIGRSRYLQYEEIYGLK